MAETPTPLSPHPPVPAPEHPDEDDEAPPYRYVDAAALHTFVAAVLRGNGTPAASADLVAQCLVAADLRGVDSHGANRLPSYVARVRAGVLDAAATPEVTKVAGAVALVDGRNGFGAVAAAAGIDAACEMARELGVGLAGVRRSNHFGMSAWTVQRAVDAGFAALVFTNSSPALPPYGGRARLLGVSPIACGAPGGAADRPFVLDMAPSVAARGKIHKAKRRGEKIPLDWALDADGRPTDDPAAALDGVMLPMGGPKGSGLAIMMDVFSGVLTGSAFGGDVTGPYDASRPSDVGHFLVALKPDLFVSGAEFRARMAALHARVVGAERAPGVDRIYFPGEIEQLTRDARARAGIPLAPAEVDALNDEARRVGCPLLVLNG
ncbi:malate dehydrogenase [Durotheca rogersii]|uniref:malate dehydrogenase n=1 Tax=Durotheca rogersii TaxID=419775 RepID=UPI00221E9F5A|nr:malate dehydrogenase [Durotheca rogersii]KAI5864803.1 malate dehydrogenase [Durotheca rogersii]